MSREWKPGDVAMVTGRWIRTEDHSERYAVRRGEGWISRGRLAMWVGDWEVSAVRPLVVIDYDDAEQVVRFLASYFGTTTGRVTANDLDRMQAALREFANPTPPKPTEPTGLGAVIEDGTGDRWVRVNEGTHNWRGLRTGRRYRWSDLDVAAVLSEGVPS